MTEITLRKTGSAHKVTFTLDPEDPFFTSVEMQTLKSGKIVASHYILTSDRPQWFEQYSREGFREVKEASK